MDDTQQNGDVTSQVTYAREKRGYFKGINPLLLTCRPLMLSCLYIWNRDKFHRKELDDDTEYISTIFICS
jgi:hypothetical protein